MASLHLSNAGQSLSITTGFHTLSVINFTNGDTVTFISTSDGAILDEGNWVVDDGIPVRDGSSIVVDGQVSLYPEASVESNEILISGPLSPIDSITLDGQTIDFTTGSLSGAVGSTGYTIALHGFESEGEAFGAPVASAGLPQFVDAGSQVILDSTGSYDDSNIVSRLWSLVRGPVQPVFDDVSAAKPTVTLPATGEYTFQVLVTDDDGLTDTDEVVITVNGVAPVVTIAGGGQVESGTVITLEASGEVESGTIAHWLWELVSGPPLTISGANTPSATFLAPLVPGPLDLTFRASATDDKGVVGFAEVIYTVRDSIAPSLTLNVGNDAVTVGDSWVDAGALSVDAVDGEKTIYTADIPNTSVPGIYTVRYQDTDNAGNTSTTANRTIHVAPVKTSSLTQIVKHGTLHPGSYHVMLFTNAYDSDTLLFDNIISIQANTFTLVNLAIPDGVEVFGFAIHPEHGGMPIKGVTV